MARKSVINADYIKQTYPKFPIKTQHRIERLNKE